MDAYASKPIRAAELFEVIARLLPSDGDGAKGPQGSGAVFDLDIALAVVDGDRELLRRMVHVFSGQCPKLLGEIRDSVQHGDGVALERAAHKLKASVGSFGARRAYRAAPCGWRSWAGPGDVPGSKNACSELEQAVMRLRGRWPSSPGRAEQEGRDRRR